MQQIMHGFSTGWNYFRATSQTQIGESSSTNNESNKRDLLTERVTQVFENINISESDIKNRGWNKISVANNAQLIPGKKISIDKNGTLQSFYTSFNKQILPVDSRTIIQMSSRINGSNYYDDIPVWNNCMWFGVKNYVENHNTVGVLSVNLEKDLQFFPLNGFPVDLNPMLIPSHSVLGENGYVCFLECDIFQEKLRGFSLWDINSNVPEKIFSQSGFEKIFFEDKTDVIAFKSIGSSKEMECWDLKSQSLKYKLTDWYHGEDKSYINLGPYNKAKQILLAQADDNIYGFDLQNRKVAYSFNLRNEENKNSYFQLLEINDDLFFCRENDDSKVRIFDINSGKELHSFEIGYNEVYPSVRNFLLSIYGDFLFALKKDDSKTICCWDTKTGEIVKTFGPLSQNIINLSCAKDRLIVEDNNQNILIWDIESNKQLLVIPAPEGFSQSILDITDNKITLFMKKNDLSDNDQAVANEQDADKKLELTLKTVNKENDNKDLHPKLLEKKLHLTSIQQNQIKIQNFLCNIRIEFDNSIHLEVWNSEDCKHLGSIQENLQPFRSNKVIHYSSGRLIVDNFIPDNTKFAGDILIQNFNV